MIYSEPERYTPEEKKALQSFIDYCKQKSVPVPAEDPDIMRFLNRHGLDCGNEKLMTSLNERIETLQGMLPLNVNKKVYDMICSGGVYIGGRDK